MQHSSPSFLQTNLGWYRYYLWCHFNGIEVEGIDTQRNQLPKSIGHSYCLSKITNDKDYLVRIMSKLTWQAASQMRSLNLLQTGKISCCYHNVAGQVLFRSWKLPRYLYDSVDIIKQVLLLFTQPIISKINFLAVSLNDLVFRSGQLSFFTDEKKVI